MKKINEITDLSERNQKMKDFLDFKIIRKKDPKLAKQIYYPTKKVIDKAEGNSKKFQAEPIPSAEGVQMKSLKALFKSATKIVNKKKKGKGKKKSTSTKVVDESSDSEKEGESEDDSEWEEVKNKKKSKKLNKSNKISSTTKSSPSAAQGSAIFRAFTGQDRPKISSLKEVSNPTERQVLYAQLRAHKIKNGTWDFDLERKKGEEFAKRIVAKNTAK